MPRTSLSALSVLLLALGACAPADREAARDYSADVAALADEAWRHTVSQSPYLQVRGGDLIRELPDYTLEDTASNAAFARTMLERLDAIPLDSLEHQDWITAAPHEVPPVSL